MHHPHPFEKFLQTFAPAVAHKSRQLNKAVWLLETTGASDAADLKAELDAECRLLFHDAATYQKLLAWDGDAAITDAQLKRQLNVLIRAFKQNQLPKALVEEIAQKEAALSQAYAGFRAEFEGQAVSENEILALLKKENDPRRRKAVWQASKCIGDILAPQILALVALRNQAAKSLGYSDYFQLQLNLQEVDGNWLTETLETLMQRSDDAYTAILGEIERQQAERFGVAISELEPWAWSDPFGQADPLGTLELDALVTGVDLSLAGAAFYQRIGIDVQPILERSDMYERVGKNQHAFCINIDRGNDVRTLNNVQPTIKWLETVLHELGHAVYELGFADDMPWLLREPPHMITTEAMALLAGRQAYRKDALARLTPSAKANEPLMQTAAHSLRRRQLIFSRWVLVMTAFERELYRDPKQDLNRLWWELVAKYQKIAAPKGRAGKNDWAAKYHIGLAPVYYFSYLLGEMFASEIEEMLMKETGSYDFASPLVGNILQQRLFQPANSLSWPSLIKHVTGQPLNGEAWLRQFASTSTKNC